MYNHKAGLTAEQLEQYEDELNERRKALQRAMAANDWAYKGKTPRVVNDWTTGKVGVVSGNERIL